MASCLDGARLVERGSRVSRCLGWNMAWPDRIGIRIGITIAHEEELLPGLG